MTAVQDERQTVTDGKRRKQQRSEKQKRPLLQTTEGEVSPFDHPGSRVRVKSSAARRGWYAPSAEGAPSTTRQVEILNTAIIGTPTGFDGIVQGRDVVSQTPFTHDAVTAYNAVPRRVSSPNAVTLGDVGAGKSTKCKVGLMRELVPLNRRALIFDKKAQGDEGEYANVARLFGSEPIRFSLDGQGTKINMLDPLIAQTMLDDRKDNALYRSRDSRFALLQNAVELVRGGHELSSWDEEALRAALRETDRHLEGGRTATISDLLPHLGYIADYARTQDGLREGALDALHEAGVQLRFTLHTLLDSYGGMLDGETSKDVDLRGKITSWDISQLPEDGPAIPVVMQMGYSWLLGRVRAERGVKTSVIWEEGWHAIDGPIAKYMRSSQKLSRALGIANQFNLHKASDLDTGERSNSKAILEESPTTYIFRLGKREDADWACKMFDLPRDTADTIMHLPDGQFIAKVGKADPVQVHNILSPLEARVTNTDEALAE